jgi:hypothetical protein
MNLYLRWHIMIIYLTIKQNKRWQTTTHSLALLDNQP